MKSVNSFCKVEYKSDQYPKGIFWHHYCHYYLVSVDIHLIMNQFDKESIVSCLFQPPWNWRNNFPMGQKEFLFYHHSLWKQRSKSLSLLLLLSGTVLLPVTFALLQNRAVFGIVPQPVAESLTGLPVQWFIGEADSQSHQSSQVVILQFYTSNGGERQESINNKSTSLPHNNRLLYSVAHVYDYTHG